ncbi:MAG: hypothetical protein HW390_346 [Candidatus Brocadiaceae bacterium]|nr:hypothetical protein [Candidatus Brocadiaceae bacterium]
MTAQDKQQSNPFSTGGGGGSFEVRVQAAFAVLMLTGGVAPCLPSWPIIKIKLQGKYAGFDTDDCIVFAQDTQTRRECKLLAQIKHAVSITEGDRRFSETILLAWKDFNNPNIFLEGTDAIALITGPLNSTDINHVRPLLEWARHCADADEFLSKVNTAKFSSENKQNKLSVFRYHLKSANSGADVEDDVLWRFLKSFHLIGYDLDAVTGSTLSLLHTLILQNTSNQQPDGVWSQIVTFIQDADKNAGTITLNTIPENIRSCFNTSLNRNWATDLQKLYDHSSYILRGIRTKIAGVHIKRQDVFCQLLDISETSSFVLLSGERGCGKSSIVREFAQFMENRHPVFCLRTEDLNESHLDRAFSAMGLQSSLSDLAAGFAMMPKRFLLVESLEKLLELKSTGAFTDLIHFLQIHPEWTVIASGRDYAYQQITFHYLEPHGISWSSLTIPEFSSNDIDSLCSQIEALKPLGRNDAIRKLLRIPFFADLAARVVATGTRFSKSDGEEAFRSAVWRDVISKEQERMNGLPLKRKRAFIDIAVKRAKLMVYGVSENEFDSDALLKLEEDSLIQRDPKKALVSPAHDVLEDWALEAFIEETFQQNTGNLSHFLNAVGSEPAMNRAFRLWLNQMLKNEPVKDLVLAVLRDTTLQTYWQDEAISAVLMGDNPIEFLHNLRNQLFENKGELLKRVCFILRISCKAPDYDLIRQIAGGDDKINRITEARYLRPYGKGWESIISFLYENKTCITEEFLPYLAAVLDEWTSLIHIEKDIPPPAREAGLLSLHLIEMVGNSYREEDNTKKLLTTIIKTVSVIKPEFLALIERDIFRKDEHSNRRLPAYVHQLLPMALTGLETTFLCKHVPDSIINLAWQQWLIKEVDKDSSWMKDEGVVESFGLHEYNEGANFFPASGIKGPFAHLLRFHPRKGLDFIIELCNRTAEKYANATLDRKERQSFFPVWFTEGVFTIKIPLNDGTYVKQYCSHRLWLGYRGTAVLPYLLQSALMALENWLIALTEHNKTSIVEWLIDHILRNSNSVMPTAVIASVATGFPDKLGKSALPLLRTPELYHWDFHRCLQESTAFGAGFTPDPLWKLYDEERKIANHRSWRKEHLENLAIRLQFTDLRGDIFKILDEFRANIPSKSDINGEDDERWRFRLHRMDIRGWEPKEDKENKRILFTTKDLEPDLREIQEKTQEEQTLNNRFMALFLWSEHTFKGESLEREYYTNWQEALREAKSLLELLKSGNVSELARMHFGAIVKTAAIFLRDYSAGLEEADVEWCSQLVTGTVLANANTEDRVAVADATGHDGSIAAAQVLPILFDFTKNEDEKKLVKHVIATALTHANATVCEAAAQGIQKHLWQREPEFAQACIEGTLEYARLRLEEIENRRKAQRWQHPVETEDSVVPKAPKEWLPHFRERIVAGKISTNPTLISFDSHSAWHLLAPCLMIPDGSTKPEHIVLLSRILLLLMAAEESKNQDRHGVGARREIPQELVMEFSKRFADYLLSVSISEIVFQRFVDLLIERVERSPDFLDFLMVCLLHSSEKRKEIGLYWNLWEKLSKKIIELAINLKKKSRQELSYDNRSKLIRRMLFADVPWQQVRTEQDILIPGLDLSLNFVEKTGENPIVFEAMSRFLFYFPKLFMPRGLIILAKHQKANQDADLFSGVNTVFYLERVLQNLLILSPVETLPPRKDCLVLLNAMIETGSSCAYFIRDHMLHSGRNI